MIVLSEAELALLAGAGGLAAYAGRQKQNCPFHRALLVASNVALAGGGLYILWRSWGGVDADADALLRGVIGVKRRGRKAHGGGKEEDPRVAAVLSLVRQNILELEPYRCARDDYSEGILLDANENSFGAALPPADRDLKLERYPDPYQQALKQKIAEYRGVRPEQIFVGVGSDEAIDLLMRVFCEPGRDRILITPPTYGMYKVSAKTNDVGIVSVPLTPDFEVRVPEVSAPSDGWRVHWIHMKMPGRLGLGGAILERWMTDPRMVRTHMPTIIQVLAAVTPRVKLIFLCSPGNPTAKLVPLAVVEEVLQGGECTAPSDLFWRFESTESKGGSHARLTRPCPVQSPKSPPRQKNKQQPRAPWWWWTRPTSTSPTSARQAPRGSATSTPTSSSSKPCPRPLASPASAAGWPSGTPPSSG